MKLISWNVNGLRAVMSKGNLIPFIEAEQPDIMAFQETKMQEDQLNFNFDGYFRYMNSALRKGYSGTMVLSKEKPLKVIYDIINMFRANRKANGARRNALFCKFRLCQLRMGS